MGAQYSVVLFLLFVRFSSRRSKGGEGTQHGVIGMRGVYEVDCSDGLEVSMDRVKGAWMESCRLHRYLVTAAGVVSKKL